MRICQSSAGRRNGRTASRENRLIYHKRQLSNCEILIPEHLFCVEVRIALLGAPVGLAKSWFGVRDGKYPGTRSAVRPESTRRNRTIVQAPVPRGEPGLFCGKALEATGATAHAVRIQWKPFRYMLIALIGLSFCRISALSPSMGLLVDFWAPEIGASFSAGCCEKARPQLQPRKAAAELATPMKPRRF